MNLRWRGFQWVAVLKGILLLLLLLLLLLSKFPPIENFDWRALLSFILKDKCDGAWSISLFRHILTQCIWVLIMTLEDAGERSNSPCRSDFAVISYFLHNWQQILGAEFLFQVKFPTQVTVCLKQIRPNPRPRHLLEVSAVLRVWKGCFSFSVQDITWQHMFLTGWKSGQQDPVTISQVSDWEDFITGFAVGWRVGVGRRNRRWDEIRLSFQAWSPLCCFFYNVLKKAKQMVHLHDLEMPRNQA